MAAGKEIKRLRENNVPKISAALAASLIGVDAERLRKWEQRDADPSDLEDAHKIEQYFGVALNDLKNIGNFQFIKRSMPGGGKDAFIEIATKMHDAGHFNMPNDYLQELKERIKSLEKDKDFIHETYGDKLKQMQANLDAVLKNQQLLQSQISVAFHLIVEEIVDEKKREEVLNEFDKLTFADRD